MTSPHDQDDLRASALTINGMQAAVHAWISQWDEGYFSPLSNLARLTEEVGELAREYNHRFGPKKKKTTEAPAALEEELADVLWILLCMANQQGIDLESAFEATMRKIIGRDAGRFTSEQGP